MTPVQEAAGEPHAAPSVGLPSPEAFLRALHPDSTPGVTEVRVVEAGTAHRSFTESPPTQRDVHLLMGRYPAGNLYVGVAKRRDRTSGKKQNCAGLYCLFADIDFKDLPEAEARKAIDECPLRPSAVVATGGGLHVYWFLIDPLDAVTEREEAESMLRRLAAYFRSDPAVAEVARVLRVPGTLNFKYAPARPVTLELLDEECNYNLSDFVEWLPPDPGKPRVATAAAVGLAIPEGQRHATLMRELGALRRRGGTESDVRALAGSMAGRMVPPYPAEELERDICSVLGWPAGEPPTLIDDVVLDHAPGPPAELPSGVVNWRSAREACTAAPTEPELIVRPYFYAGATTKIDAPPKKGKTTLRNYLVGCALRGLSCLGYPASDPTPVVLLTEEPEAVIVEGLRAAGLEGRDDLHFVTLFDLRQVKWPAAIKATRAKARDVGARMVWIDTLPALARIAGDDENKAGVALAVMAPLADLTADGLAVGLTYHERKSGGELGESGRGSSAFAGAVDVIVQMKSAKGLRDTCRELHAIGRFRGIPRVLTVELVSRVPSPNSADPSWCESGRQCFIQVDPGDVAGDDSTARVLAELPATADAAVTVTILADRAELSQMTTRRALDTLTARRQVKTVGAGTRFSPRRYYRRSSPVPNRGTGSWEPEVES